MQNLSPNHDRIERLPLPFHFHPNLILMGKASSLPLVWSPVKRLDYGRLGPCVQNIRLGWK